MANGWYDRDLNEHHFWKQSNRLVQGEKVWESIRKQKPGFTCANLFWWYNMYSSVDFSITPRPLYRSDGLKAFDIHSQPMNVRDQVKKDLETFPSPPSGDLEPALNLPAGLQMLRGRLKIVINLT